MPRPTTVVTPFGPAEFEYAVYQAEVSIKR